MKFSEIEITNNDIIRFWEKIDIKNKHECWIWTAAVGKSGYGAFRIGGRKGKIIMPHRFSSFLSHDNFYEDMLYLHSCDNPICCNPNHLRPGTSIDNIKDRTKRSRNKTQRPGNGYIKINSDKRKQIIDMKLSGKNNCEIGRIMGVTSTRVSQIYNEYLKS